MLAPDDHTCCGSSCELRQDSQQQGQLRPQKVIASSRDNRSSPSSLYIDDGALSKSAKLASNCRMKMPKNEKTEQTDAARVGRRSELVKRFSNGIMQELQVRSQLECFGKRIINCRRNETQLSCCYLNEVIITNSKQTCRQRANCVFNSDNKSPMSHLFFFNYCLNFMPMLLLISALTLVLIAAGGGQPAVLAATNTNSYLASLSSPSALASNLIIIGEEQLVMPPYMPTRAPLASRQQQQNHHNSSIVKQPGAATATTNVRGQQVALGSVPLSSLEEPKVAGSSTKFTKTNELNVFLDDMNHNELRTVVTGGQIDDFLKPKSLATGAAEQQQPQQGSLGAKLPPQQQRKRSPTTSASISGNDNDVDGDTRTRVSPASQAADLDSGSPSQPQMYSECALILQRTYVKNLDDPKHQLVPYGKTEQACISYKHIDKAVEQAKHQLKFRELTKKRKKGILVGNDSNRKPLPPFEIVHSTLEPPEDLIATIGEINMATTQIIADQFDLSHDELLNGLPLIDMSKTKFWPICPLVVKQDLKCELTRFRTFTGHCNNLKHPTWGAAMTPFARYLPPVHPDGIWVPRKSIVFGQTSFDKDSHHYNPMKNNNDEMIDINNNNHHHHFDESIGGHNIDIIDDSNINNLEHEGSRQEEPGSDHGNNYAHMPTMPMPVFHHDHVHHHQHIHTNEMAASSTSVKFVRHVYPEHKNSHVQAQVDIERQQSNVVGNSPIRAQSTLVDSFLASHSGVGGSIIGASNTDGSLTMASSSSAPQTPSLLIGERIVGSHYQQSHSPGRPYVAKVTPISQDHPMPQLRSPNSLPGGQLQLQRHQRQQHQSLAMAATMPMHQLHKSRAQMALELPSARLVTSVVHRDVDLPHHDFTILFMSWGQLLDHDLTRAAQSPSSIRCCNKDGKPKHRLCLPIQVPQNDPFYSKFDVDCLEFRRSLAGVRPNCVLGPRVHQNAITSPIDANFIYGSSQALAEALRLFKGGRLRDRDWFKREGLKPILPAQDMNPDLECIARPKDLFCFLAGDVRANEQTHLTVLHTLYMREHNRIADKLAELNPHWEDERIYQETRHIMAAGVQHVMINEYVPLLIGRKMSELYNLTAQPHDIHAGKHSYWRGYDPSVTTSVSNSFAAAAFRQGHTFVQGSVERYNKYHEFVASEKLRHLFKQPFLIYQPGVIDELTGGMINQPSQSYDPFISEDISGHLFQPPESQFGHDLAAINLQRGREQGLPGYNLFREWCGLPRAENFDQLEPYLTNHTAFHYSKLYKHVDDIDLWSGGVSERKLPGAAIGPTFACIIARQFSNTRRGDRFWYENPGLPSSFTPEQLAEIRKITLAKTLCANSDDLPTIQRWALRMPHPVLNPRIPCHELPEIDLQFWQEE